MENEQEITGIIRMARKGHQGANEHLCSVIADELRRVLPSKLTRVGPNEFLRPDEVVRHVGADLIRNPGADSEDRSFFLILAARQMRMILVERAREYLQGQKRITDKSLPLERVDSLFNTHAAELPAVDEALHSLVAVDPRLVRLVELRFFAGQSVERTAEATASSVVMVQRDWSLARTFIATKIAAQRAVPPAGLEPEPDSEVH